MAVSGASLSLADSFCHPGSKDDSKMKSRQVFEARGRTGGGTLGSSRRHASSKRCTTASRQCFQQFYVDLFVLQERMLTHFNID